MKFSHFYKPLLLSLALSAAGCVTYGEDIRISDTEGNVYRKPRKESSYEMQRNEPERIATIPKGRKGFANFEYSDGQGIRRKGRFRIDPAKSYVIYRTTEGELYFYEAEPRETER